MRTIILSLSWLAICAATPIYTFTSLPASGDISGAPGDTIGWGYSITNEDLTDYLVLTDLSAGTFLNGAASGIFDFPILAPDTTVTLAFDSTLGQGLYQLTWDPAAPNGFVNSGNFIVTADWYDGDPFNGGNPIAGLTGVTASQAYTATVVQSAGVPEPGTVALVIVGLIACACIRTRNNLL